MADPSILTSLSDDDLANMSDEDIESLFEAYSKDVSALKAGAGGNPTLLGTTTRISPPPVDDGYSYIPPHELQQNIDTSRRAPQISEAERLASIGFKNDAEKLRYLAKKGLKPFFNSQDKSLLLEDPERPNTFLHAFDTPGIGVWEQSAGGSARELLADTVDLAPDAAAMFAKNPLYAGVAGALTGVVRQRAREDLGLPFDTTQFGTDALLPLGLERLGAGVRALRGKTGSGIVSQVDKAGNFVKQSAASLAKPGTLLAKGYTGAKDLLTKVITDPNRKAAEYGFSAADLNPQNKVVASEFVEWVGKNLPRQWNIVDSQLTMRNKYNAAASIQERASKTIGKTLGIIKDPIPVNSIFNSKGFKELLNSTSSTAQYSRSFRAGNRELKEVFTTLAQPFKKQLESSPSKYLTKSGEALSEWDAIVKGVASPRDAMSYLGGYSLPPTHTFELRQSVDKLARWGAETDKIPASVEAVRKFANSLRSTFIDELGYSSSLSLAQQKAFRRATDTYHNVTPIVEAMGSKVGKSVTGNIIDPGLWPTKFNSAGRKGLTVMNTLARNPGVTGVARGVVGGLNAPANAISKATNMFSNLTGVGFPETSKMVGSILARSRLDSTMNEPITGFTGADPSVLSTEFTESPQVQQMLTMLPPQIASTLMPAMSSPNSMLKAEGLATLNKMMPGVLPTGRSGYSSEVVVAGRPRMMIDQDRADYLASLQTKLKSKEIDSVFMARQVSAFNDLNNLEILPLPSAQPTVPEPIAEEEPSSLETLSKLFSQASAL